ncbi:hypothetical protein GCK72_006724 [Caenorhabditis remanei]|uniref:PX domain-containing protein n=1 Tax=Caenorhabditis remanei TaxID=31234 RepID=A0A6A5HJA2_CAERE|nr:hypothetical protein GCK72_006724 [Caenorhabditis remanei]KAF1766766.1 hypothetical protein GCK72_006724 [Caenorhabditis remanei]
MSEEKNPLSVQTVTATNDSIYDDIDLNDNTTAEIRYQTANDTENISPPVAIEHKQVEKQDDTIFKVKVCEFEKRGGFFDVHFVFRVETQVEGVVGFTRKRYDTWRRFNDFLVLHEKIVDKYQQKGIIIPQPPEKKVSVMAKAMASSNNFTDPQLLQRARQLERFMNRLIQHPRIRADCDIRDFLTLDTELPSTNPTPALAGIKMMKAIRVCQETFEKLMAPIGEEVDQWFEITNAMFEDFDSNIRKLYSESQALMAHRKDMAASGEKFALNLSLLAASEESMTLSLALAALTETYEKASSIWNKQSEINDARFSESIDEYISLLSSLRDVFSDRVHVWHQWKKFQRAFEEKRAKKTEVELTGNWKQDELNKLSLDILENKQKMIEFEKKFDQVSKSIQEEVERFETGRKDDMKNMLIEYLEDMIKCHTELSKLWQQFEPYAHKIQN